MDRAKGIRPRGGSIEIDFYVNGERCREVIKLTPTKPNILFARRKREAILHEIAIGTFNYLKHFPDSARAQKLSPKAHSKSVANSLDQWLAIQSKRCAYSTIRDYQSAIEFHLKPVFGETLLSELSTSDIQLWIATLSISNKRINNVLIPLRGICESAFIDGLIDRNPSARVKNLANWQEEPQPFSMSEITSILSYAVPQVRNFLQFAFATGLRTGELIALRWSDIDLKKGVVYVQRSSVRKRTKAPKTKAGEREVKLLPPALEALQSQREFSQLKGETIFLNPRTGVAWETDQQIRKSCWQALLKVAGVAYRNPYQTRHTYASMMLSAGENPMWVAKQMGHKDWGMLRKRYGRWIPDTDNTAGDRGSLIWSRFGHKETVNA